MKNLLFAVLLLASCVCYAQENGSEGSITDQIEMLSTEVGSSGVIQFSFDESKVILFRVFSQNEEVYSEVLEVNQGVALKKVDFSELESGSHTIKFYIDEVIVKQLEFTKF